MEESGCRSGGFIRQDGREGNPGVIINSHMHVFSADAARGVGQIAGDAMAGLGDAAQLFDVQMQHVARLQVFVAMHRRARFQIAQAAEL